MAKHNFRISEQLETISDLLPAFGGLVLAVITYLIFHDPIFSVVVATVGAALSLYYTTTHITKYVERTTKTSKNWNEVRATSHKRSAPQIFVNGKSVVTESYPAKPRGPQKPAQKSALKPVTVLHTGRQQKAIGI